MPSKKYSNILYRDNNAQPTGNRKILKLIGKKNALIKERAQCLKWFDKPDIHEYMVMTEIEDEKSYDGSKLTDEEILKKLNEKIDELKDQIEFAKTMRFKHNLPKREFRYEEDQGYNRRRGGDDWY